MKSEKDNSKTPKKSAGSTFVYNVFVLAVVASTVISIPYLCQTYQSEQTALQRELDRISSQIKQNTVIIQNMQVKLEAFKGEQITLQADALGLHKPAPQHVVQIDAYGRRRNNGFIANVQHGQHPDNGITDNNQHHASMKN